MRPCEERTSENKLNDVFGFGPAAIAEPGQDFLSEEDIPEASALPLDIAARKALIESSMRQPRDTRLKSSS